MSELDDRIAEHYGADDLLAAILDRLRAAGRDLDSLSTSDLAPVDAFHMRGLAATAELARLGELPRGCRVLDLGCGLGGSARYLAAELDCTVTGVDVTESYCGAARELSRLLGLEKRTVFERASALALPFEAGSYDIVLTEHMQMNVEEKTALYAEISRVLRPGGRYLFHEIMAGSGGEPLFPVPWADDPSLSFLGSAPEVRAILEETGFRVLQWRDVSDEARAFVEAGRARPKPAEPPLVSLHLLLGEDATEKFRNMVRNLDEERIALFMGVLEKPRA